MSTIRLPTKTPPVICPVCRELKDAFAPCFMCKLRARIKELSK